MKSANTTGKATAPTLLGSVGPLGLQECQQHALTGSAGCSKPAEMIASKNMIKELLCDEKHTQGQSPAVFTHHALSSFGRMGELARPLSK